LRTVPWYFFMLSAFIVNFSPVGFVLWLMAVLMSYFIMLWSELLSSSLIFQSDILLSTLLVTSVKSMLLLPVRLSKVEYSLVRSLYVAVANYVFFQMLSPVARYCFVPCFRPCVTVHRDDYSKLFACSRIASTLVRSCSKSFCL
jgi:hypothetical protein